MLSRTLALTLPTLAVVVAVVAGVGAAHAVTPEEKAEAAALRDVCKADYLKVCGFTRPGGGRGLACLEEKSADLSPACRDALPRAKALRDKLKATRG